MLKAKSCLTLTLSAGFSTVYNSVLKIHPFPFSLGAVSL